MEILFLYNRDWSHEIADYYSGKVPSHRLFGLHEVNQLGHHAFACSNPRPGKKTYNVPLLWRVHQALQSARRQKHIDCIVATHEAAALPVLLLKRFGLLRTPIVVVNVALLSPQNLNGKKFALWKQLLPYADAIVSYASAQITSITDSFGLNPKKLSFIPLGVDVNFFKLCPPGDDSGLLSVGTNEGKDYATLIKALPAQKTLIVVTDSANAAIIAENSSEQHCVEVRQDVPIVKLRTLYQNAKLHIIPLHETLFSTGQTVLLENMAMGKAVLVTRTTATQDYVENDVTALCVEAGNVEQMNRRIQEFLDNPQAYRDIGFQAAERVRGQFTTQHFAAALLDTIAGLMARKVA